VAGTNWKHATGTVLAAGGLLSNDSSKVNVYILRLRCMGTRVKFVHKQGLCHNGDVPQTAKNSRYQVDLNPRS
jgi:hypothetical protein